MGSRSTQETKIPAYIEEAGKKALERAQQIQDLGYVPYMGPEIAAINESERALNRNVGAMASAFGLEGPAPLTMGDAEVTSAGGVSGYSSYPAYMAALQRLQEQRPDQYAYLAGLGRFDPITGAAIAPPPVPEVTTGPLGVSPVSGGNNNDDSLSHAEIMQMHYGNPAGPSGSSGYNVTTSFGSGSTPKPVLPSQSTGSLFSGLSEAKNKVLDALGVI